MMTNMAMATFRKDDFSVGGADDLRYYGYCSQEWLSPWVGHWVPTSDGPAQF